LGSAAALALAGEGLARAEVSVVSGRAAGHFVVGSALGIGLVVVTDAEADGMAVPADCGREDGVGPD